MRRTAAVCFLFAAIAVFYAATIRPGNQWGDDFALFIRHAQNLALGRNYTDTGYIYNPSAPEYSPRIYPPVFPLLLAPLCRLSGLNFAAMKREEVMFFLLALLALYFYWWKSLDFPWLLALVFLLGFNPVFWSAKDDVLSDLPFLFFFCLAALLVQGAPREGKESWKWALLAGLVLYLCIGTRSIGATLLPGIVLYDFLSRRRLSAFSLIALGPPLALSLAQRALIGPGLGSYADQFHLTARALLHNLAAYAHSLGTFWLAPDHRMFSAFVYGLLLVLALAGAWLRIRRGFTAMEAMVPPYVFLVLIWPVHKGIPRYLFPALPVFVYWALTGLDGLTARLARGYRVAGLAGLVALVGFSYILSYRETGFGPIAESDGSVSFRALCQIVGATTKPQDVFIYRRARALTLFTSRAAATYEPGDPAALWTCARRIHAGYVITNGQLAEDREFLVPLIKKFPDAFEPVYRNADFGLYRIRAYP